MADLDDFTAQLNSSDDPKAAETSGAGEPKE